jgi:hypothetical protein
MEKIDKEELLAKEDVEIRVSKLTESLVDNLDLLGKKTNSISNS